MRATQHSGRWSRQTGNVYGTSHNDRTFEGKADNIDSSRTCQNVTWNIYGSDTFEDAERRFYEETFGDTLKALNAGYVAKSHPDRVKTMDEWRKSKAHCPEEVILQIGKVGEHATPEIFKACVAKYVEHMNFCDNIQVLDYAIHLDEAVPHAHIRRVWLAEDSKGNCTVNQSKALAEMGIERPDKTQPKGRYNNAKMTFDANMRSVWLDICESYGLEVEREPEKNVRHNRTKEEYVRDKLRVENEELRTVKCDLSAQIFDLSHKKELMDKYLSEGEKTLKSKNTASERLSEEIDELEKRVSYLRTVENCRNKAEETLDIARRVSTKALNNLSNPENGEALEYIREVGLWDEYQEYRQEKHEEMHSLLKSIATEIDCCHADIQSLQSEDDEPEHDEVEVDDDELGL